jgi:type I restriction enzyme R subunit
MTRDAFGNSFHAYGWVIQDKSGINLHAASGVAVREYLTDAGPADYLLFVHGRPAGVIKAKREEEGHKLSTHEDQAEEYVAARLKYLNNEKLPFVYLSTGEVTSFIDFRDPKPRASGLFSFHRPETLGYWLKKSASLRDSFRDLPGLPPD